MVMFLGSHSQFGTTYTDLSSKEMRSFHGHEMLCAGVEVWQDGVKHP
jgi:hypothetical protein